MADVRLRPQSRVPKVREYAEITLMDGSTLTGYVFVDATNEQIMLLNKSSIMHVRPHDEV
jgi:hypothetical protein